MANILVVDDDETILTDVAAILTGAGHRVITASHPPQALAKVETEVFDLIITDLNMPHMSGHDYISLLHKLPNAKATYIAVLSSSKDMHDVASAAQNGIRDYVLKPVDPPVFIVKVESMLEKAAALREKTNTSAAAHKD